MSKPLVAPNWLASHPGIREHEPLARHSQYGIGGPADWYVEIGDVAELSDFVRHCNEDGVAVTVVGAGSNTLILDGGVRGVAIRLTNKQWQRIDSTTVEAGGAMMMPRLALDCAKAGIGGLEFGIGVPGTCGASVRGNAGAFGREMKDVLINCMCVGPDGDIHEHPASECSFAYRQSAFKTSLAGHIVMEARLSIHDSDPTETRARTDEIQAQRKASQPYGVRSLGSVFTNPSGDHAGRLIETCGLKGKCIGGAEISTKHANFIVNVDNATARDVLALVELAHETVLERWGVDLEREIAVMGSS